MLERDAPLPARAARGRAGEGIGLAGERAGHRDRAVAGQPVLPVLVAGAERLLDQQPAKARAVDEQVARRSVGRPSSVTASTWPSSARRCDTDDLALDARDAARFGIAAQVARVEAGIEVEGVEQLADRRAARPRSRARSGPARRRPRSSTRREMSGSTRALALAQIELVEMDALQVLADSGRTGGNSARPSAPQSTNSMPSLNVAPVAARNSFSFDAEHAG